MASTAYAKQDQGRGRDVRRLADWCLGEEREKKMWRAVKKGRKRTKKTDGGTQQGEEMRRKKECMLKTVEEDRDRVGDRGRKRE